MRLLFITFAPSMWIVKRKTLHEFWLKYEDSKQQLLEWFHTARRAHWVSINDVRKDYPSADLVDGKKVVFNIKGNKYRLIIKVNFEYHKAWIKFIGTHAEYDKIDIRTF